MRVVVVETQAHVRTALVFLLQQQPDLEVLCAFGPGPDLVARTLALRPEVILLDWDLPGQLARRVLAARNRLADAPYVIMLCTRPEDEAPALAAGADALVSKGEPPELVLRAIRSAQIRTPATLVPCPPPLQRSTAHGDTATTIRQPVVSADEPGLCLHQGGARAGHPGHRGALPDGAGGGAGQGGRGAEFGEEE